MAVLKINIDSGYPGRHDCRYPQAMLENPSHFDPANFT